MDSPSVPKPAFVEPSLPAPLSTSSAAGLKRPAPSLLPAFEPLSSSPGLPRPLKRQNTASGHAHLRYPTPVPTSSTGILSSSPVRRPVLMRGSSERAPLSAVPAVELSENGEPLLMGRSSNSSHFQLSANRLVSRVHVRARYVPAASLLDAGKIEITCSGWNGLKLHCQGRTWELLKGDSFTSETEGSEIMVDVQDARVMIQWPKRVSASAADAAAGLSDSSCWEDSPPRSLARGGALLLQSSPLRRATRIESPVSPTPGAAAHQRLRSLLPDDDDRGIQIYEDEPELPAPKTEQLVEAGVSMRTEATASFSSDVAEESDPDEENDPIVHSFGPFGANIASRLASITTKSPRALLASKRLHKTSSIETLTQIKFNNARESEVQKPKPKQQRPLEENPALESSPLKKEPVTGSAETDAAILNHVVNQLAFSRLSSTPLSTIMQNLPSDQTKDLSRDALREVIESTTCIGIILRQGKDAAGKPLESEYYYVPESDNDEQRRAAVVDGLRKPSLRSCRKQHKQYYWKRPKTP